MSLAWSISHPKHLVVVVAKGDLQHHDIELLLLSIRSAHASGYRKFVDVTRLAIPPRPQTLRQLGGVVHQPESEQAIVPIAIVARKGASLRQANAVAKAAEMKRLIRGFSDKDEARRWLDSFYAFGDQISGRLAQ
jgi:hypothetical protein